MRAIVLLCALALAGVPTFAAGRPEWCRAGWECVPTEEIVADAEQHYAWREEIVRLKVRVRRFGCVVGGGGGISAVVDENWGLQSAPAAHLGVTCGWRFP